MELVRVEEATGYAERRRALFGVPHTAPPQDSILNRIKPGKKEDSGESASSEEVRTLWVDFDDQGERHKRWREVVTESYTPAYDEKPLEGPLTALHVMKHMERHGGDPRQWLGVWARTKHIEPTDRVYHELKVLTDCLYFSGTFDQVNIPALMGQEVVCRRIQAVVDAYMNPSRPSWENAKVFSGMGAPEDIISPSFRTYATKRNKDELELLQARIKVRELRGAPASTSEDGQENQMAPKKGPKGGGRKGGQGDNA